MAEQTSATKTWKWIGTGLGIIAVGVGVYWLTYVLLR